jgi:hypothetical protein
MKGKKLMVMGMFLLVALAVVAPQIGNAADLLWADFTINKVYQLTGKVQLRLDYVDGTFTNKLFETSSEKQGAILAVVLTALSLDKQVRVGFYEGATPTAAAIIQAVGIIN